MLYPPAKTFRLWPPLAVLILVACFSHATAQAQKKGLESKTSKPVVSVKVTACVTKKEALAQIKEFIEQARKFQDLGVKVRAAGELGLLLWPCEWRYAETTLLELHKELRSEIERRQDTPRTTTSNNPSAGDDAVSVGRLTYLDGYIISRINLHDRALVTKLAKTEAINWEDVRYSTIRTLFEQGDFKRGADELSKSLASVPKNPDLTLLLSLRERDPATADAIYSAYLSSLRGRPSPTAREFLEAGSYLFVSNNTGDNQSVGLVLASVDGTFVPQFAMKHPAASDNAVQLYLSLVATLLQQPSESLSEKKARYALGRVLFPFVSPSRPELIASFLASLQRLTREVTDGIKNDRVYESLGNEAKQNWDNIDQQLDLIEKIALTDQRDEFCVMFAHALYSSKLYEKALEVVKLMSSSETADKLETITRLAIGHRYISKKQFSEAEHVGFSVKPGPERSVFWLNLAEAFRSNGDDLRAVQLILQAIADARISNGSERTILLLKAADDVKVADPLLSKQLVFEALSNVNAVDKWRAPKWGVEAVAHRATLRFSLVGVKGLDFTSVLTPFVKDNPAEIKSAVMELRSEQLRMEGFLVLGKQLLANTDHNTQTKPASNELK